MSNGVLMASAGMKAQMEALDVLANNLANLNTPGFKEQKSFFSVLQDSINGTGPDGDAAGLEQGGSALNQQDGVLAPTHRDLDIALSGEGLLVVQTPQGVRYTRNGSLSINARSELATAGGMAIEGESGPITIGPGKIHITERGDVYVNGTRSGRLKIVTFDRLQDLSREGSSLFAADPRVSKPKPGDATVRQGFLEQSNVNAVGSVVEMIAIMRRFEAIQKSVNALKNDLDAKSIEKLGGR